MSLTVHQTKIDNWDVIKITSSLNQFEKYLLQGMLKLRHTKPGSLGAQSCY